MTISTQWWRIDAGRLDDVPVPADMWSRVQYEGCSTRLRMQFTEHERIHDRTSRLRTRPTGLRLRRRWMLAAAAAVLLVIVVGGRARRGGSRPA